MKTGISYFSSRWVWLVLLVCLLPVGSIIASGEGPRVHAPMPVGFSALVLNGISVQDANRTFDPSLVRPFSRFDTNIINLLYVRTLAVKNRHVMLLGQLRGGRAERRTFFLAGRELISSSGFADPFIGVSVNLVGLPPLDRNAFKDFKPGLKVNFLLGANLPLGEYDSGNVINLGSNRWTIRFSVPITRPITGIGGLPGTLEFIPNLFLFTENKDRNLKQDPLFTLEGHATQNFSRRTWGSLGFLYNRGGKTTINGLPANGSQESLALTATLGMNFSPRWGLQLRFGKSVAQNEFGLVGKVYQFKLTRSF
ncbi:MAG: transporter [Gammaproteobacteria bacterium]|nr:transporter [Gammaproteobacteria bacterium]NNL95952.1 transporter [Xanthomonadales bacterium]